MAKEKSFEVNGWKYTYTKTGIQITNPEGQSIGKPVPMPTLNVKKPWVWLAYG